MLDFEKMRAALLFEQKRLKIIIETQERLIPYMEKMDKKIFNKKIVDYLNEVDAIHAYIYNCYDRKELVISHKDLPYNYNTLFWNMQSDYCNEKRFSFEKFKETMMKRIKSSRAELAAIEADLADGEKRAEEFNYVQQYYIQLAKGFSYFIRGKYEHDFKIGWIG